MATYNVGSVAGYVQTAMLDLPTALSGNNLSNIIDLTRIRINNWTGGAVAGGSNFTFDESYYPAFCAGALLLAKAATAGQGVNFNWSNGEFSMSPNAASQPELVHYAEVFQQELRTLGRHARWTKVFG